MSEQKIVVMLWLSNWRWNKGFYVNISETNCVLKRETGMINAYLQEYLEFYSQLMIETDTA